MTAPPVVHTEPASNSPVVQNPTTDAFNVVVMVPDQIPIRMVNASVLEDYEFHIYVASLFFAATTGFLTPTIQEFRAGTALAVPFLIMTLILGAAFIAQFLMARAKRRALKAGGREIKLKTTGASL